MPSEDFSLGGANADRWSFNDDPGVKTDYANDQTNRYRGYADSLQGTNGVPKPNFAGGDKYVGQGLAARGTQSDALSMLRTQANGGGPSASNLSTTAGTDQSIAGQLGGIAGSQPGAVPLIAGAGSQNLVGNLATGSQARSGEIAGGQNAMFGGYQTQRGQDLTAQGQQDARSQYVSGLAMKQQAANQQNALQWEAEGQRVRNDELQASIKNRQNHDRDYGYQSSINAGSRGNAINTLTSAASATIPFLAMLSDARAKTNVKHEGFHTMARY